MINNHINSPFFVFKFMVILRLKSSLDFSFFEDISLIIMEWNVLAGSLQICEI